jgi:hypothetical protein
MIVFTVTGMITTFAVASFFAIILFDEFMYSRGGCKKK